MAEYRYLHNVSQNDLVISAIDLLIEKVDKKSADGRRSS